jgi:hypothetical protein
MNLKQIIHEEVRRQLRLRENENKIPKNITKHYSDGGLIGYQFDMIIDNGGKISTQKYKKFGNPKNLEPYEGYLIDGFEGDPPEYAQLYSPDGDHIGTMEFHTEDPNPRLEGHIKKINLK